MGVGVVVDLVGDVCKVSVPDCASFCVSMIIERLYMRVRFV